MEPEKNSGHKRDASATAELMHQMQEHEVDSEQREHSSHSLRDGLETQITAFTEEEAKVRDKEEWQMIKAEPTPLAAADARPPASHELDKQPTTYAGGKSKERAVEIVQYYDTAKTLVETGTDHIFMTFDLTHQSVPHVAAPETAAEVSLRHRRMNSVNDEASLRNARLPPAKTERAAGDGGQQSSSLTLSKQETDVFLLTQVWRRSFFLLIIVGVVIACFAYVMSVFALFFWKAQSKVLHSESLGNTSHLRSMQWQFAMAQYFIVITIKCALVSLAVYITSFRPASAGSGVPQVRAIINGIWIREYLGRMTFVVKYIGLCLALASGLPIGLEGPFIHLGAILARQLTKLQWFKHVDRKQTLSAACAGAVAALFGAPFGGVLFTIEVTSTYYSVSNYWTAFVCAVAGATMSHIVLAASSFKFLSYGTSFSIDHREHYRTGELFCFAFVGLLMGCVGAGFTHCHELLIGLRRKYQARLIGNDSKSAYKMACAVIVLFTSICWIFGDFAIEPARKSVADMFTVRRLQRCSVHNRDCLLVDYGSHLAAVCAKLFFFGVVSFCYSIAAVTLAIPCGVFSTSFTIGAIFGRFLGELFRTMSGGASVLIFDPRVYSVVGAAACSAAVTATISPAIIALEITSELQLSIPVLIAVLFACGVAKYLKGSFFDSVLKMRGIPLLPPAPTKLFVKVEATSEAAQDSFKLLSADDVMLSNEIVYVCVMPDARELAVILRCSPQVLFPIVSDHVDRIFIGEVRREVLFDYLQYLNPEIYVTELPSEMRAMHVTVDPAMVHLQMTNDALLEQEVNESRLVKLKKLDDGGGDESPRSTSEARDPSVMRDDDKPAISLMQSPFIERLNLSPIAVISGMPLLKVYTMFHILKPSNIYVTRMSKLVGVVTEGALLAKEKQWSLEESRDIRVLFKKLWAKMVCMRDSNYRTWLQL